MQFNCPQKMNFLLCFTLLNKTHIYYPRKKKITLPNYLHHFKGMTETIFSLLLWGVNISWFGHWTFSNAVATILCPYLARPHMEALMTNSLPPWRAVFQPVQYSIFPGEVQYNIYSVECNIPLFPGVIESNIDYSTIFHNYLVKSVASVICGFHLPALYASLLGQNTAKLTN